MSTCCAVAKTPGTKNAAAAIAAAAVARPKKPARIVISAPLDDGLSGASGALAAALVNHGAIARGIVGVHPDRGERIGVDVQDLAVVGRAGVARRPEIGLAVGARFENQLRQLRLVGQI